MSTGILLNDNDILSAGFVFGGINSLSYRYTNRKHFSFINVSLWIDRNKFKYKMEKIDWPDSKTEVDRGTIVDSEDLRSLVELAEEVLDMPV